MFYVQRAFLLICYVSAALMSGSSGVHSTEFGDRKQACEHTPLPEAYEPFLDTSFLGPERSIHAGSVNFSYHRFGPLSLASSTENTLVMIVGLGCTKSTWTPDLLKSLAANREVLVFDNRASGHSVDEHSLDEVTIKSFASSTLDLIDALEIKQPDVLGWSMGGLIALHLATYSSKAINRFIIVNSAAPKPPKTSKLTFYSEELPIHMWEGQLDPVAFFPDTPVGNAGLCRYVHLYRAMPKDGNVEDVIKAQRKALRQAYNNTEIYDRLEHVENPVLVLVGTHDGEGPASYELLSKLQTAMIVGFSDAAHGAVFQHALLAAASINDFLESDFPGSRKGVTDERAEQY